LPGYGGSQFAAAGPAASPVTAPAAYQPGPFQGFVNGGQSRAVVGARVYVLEANSAARGNPSLSLLTDAALNPADSIGHYVLTDGHGGFSIEGRYACTPERQVYLYARGGNSGDDGVNPAIGLMASLGACPQSGSFADNTPFIFVNEVTTVAAAYAMADLAPDATHVSATPEAASRMSRASELASVTTGFANGAASPEAPGTASLARIRTLANILSACVNSNGPASPGCAALFANARSNGASGALPEETATAAINIARNPHANIAALFALQPRANGPFAPALQSPPADFELLPNAQGAAATVASLSPARTAP
ncbi:MAG: hypothetical protein WAL73_01745, partial [Terracidiphilus sp.]